MKDWSDLEERYQDMRAEDPASAEDFKKQMTERFQKTVQALEEESSAEKRQLLAMHQQRVISRINQRKKEAMQCYTNSLNKSPPNTHRVQKCLQKLLRSMHKDRHHTIQHYKHLLETNMEQADREREITIEHLADIDRLVNESLQMLARYPELNTKILPLMEDYLVALRSRDNTPAPLLNMDKEHEEQMINNFRSEMEAKIKEKEREQQQEKNEKIKEKKAEEIAEVVTEQVATVETVETEPAPVKEISGDIKVEVHATAVHHDQQLEPKIAHAQAHEISHSQATYSVRRVEMPENRSVYVTLAFAGVALMVAMLIGVVVLKKRSGRYPHHQGFIEVDTAASPEEKHVANMQINGYENPTYKYFEASSA
jgi:amyloid beta A4 protein